MGQTTAVERHRGGAKYVEELSQRGRIEIPLIGQIERPYYRAAYCQGVQEQHERL